MRIRILGAAAALGVLAMAVPAAAEDEITYDELTNCAAFVLLEAQAYDRDDASKEDKAQSDLYFQQAGALTVAASIIGKKDSKVVAEEVKARHSKMLDSLGDDGYIDKLVSENKDNCNALGAAALEVITEKGK